MVFLLHVVSPVGHVAVLSIDRLTVFSLELGNELWNTPLADRYALLSHFSLPVAFGCFLRRESTYLFNIEHFS